MINKRLTSHTDSLLSSTQNISVNIISLPQGGLSLSYKLTGNLSEIDIPKPQMPSYMDGLWQHTCFELFIAVEGSTNYYEFNFSPSGQWAAYAFSDYRIPMVWKINQTPTISFIQSNAFLLLEVTIPHANLPQNSAERPLQLGMAAVIEAKDGNLTYWALHHPISQPDFHHRAGFILSLNSGLTH